MAEDESTLIDHIVAGSLAGIAEHTSVYPIDTVKTHVQAAAAEESAGSAIMVARQLVRQHGPLSLYRGVSVLVPAIGPAHALMFSGYEQVLHLGGSKRPDAAPERVAAVGAAAGIVSTFLHDSVMVPAETIKQRLQLGYYRNAMHCAQTMLASGGGSFFRSLPTTLAMNVPYCSLMMMSNESLKKWLNPAGGYDSGVVALSGALSGAFAAAVTTPLDVIKTKLQVQSLSAPPTSAGVGAAPGAAYFVQYSGFVSAVRSIAMEGASGFWLGLGPRICMYGPSCAISWAAYEAVKDLLSSRRRRAREARGASAKRVPAM